MAKRILFTGGTGKAGRHALPWLLDQGYEILNVDLRRFDHPGINTLIADITDSGQMFNAMTTHFGFGGYEEGQPPRAVDAVVHFAAIPRVLIEPDNETFRVNVMGTYNVIEAALKLGVRKVIIASSETTYGVCFAEGEKDFHEFPLEEDYDIDPMDSCGLYINSDIWHEGVFPLAERGRFFDKQGKVHARISTDFPKEFGCLLSVPLREPS
jgi:nucleoside-diphosphate-sugar epimerase